VAHRILLNKSLSDHRNWGSLFIGAPGCRLDVLGTGVLSPAGAEYFFPLLKSPDRLRYSRNEKLGVVPLENSIQGMKENTSSNAEIKWFFMTPSIATKYQYNYLL
jgi:hypothetical protein